MTMLAEVVDAVIGIDTHRDSHEVEIADAAGKPIAALRIGNDSGGFAQLLARFGGRGPRPARRGPRQRQVRHQSARLTRAAFCDRPDRTATWRLPA
jgi:hypothetical protein